MRKLIIAMLVIIAVLFVATIALLATACAAEPPERPDKPPVIDVQGVTDDDNSASSSSLNPAEGHPSSNPKPAIRLLDILIIVLTVVTVAAFSVLIFVKERRRGK